MTEETIIPPTAPAPTPAPEPTVIPPYVPAPTPNIEADIATIAEADVKKAETEAPKEAAAPVSAPVRPARPSVSVDHLAVLDYVDEMARFVQAGGVV